MQDFLAYPRTYPARGLKNPREPLTVTGGTGTALGGSGASIYVFVSGEKPVKYTDPDGKIIRTVSADIHQQDSTETLGFGSDTIAQSGCVLTTFLRIANEIGGGNFTLKDANDRAKELKLYVNNDELSVSGGSKLISELTGKKVIGTMYEGTEKDIKNIIKGLAEDPYEEYFVTGRIEAHNSSGTSKFGHQININERSQEGIQPIVDTSNRDRKSTEGDQHGKEPLFRVYVFNEVD
jgi:hypothetical protein